MTQGKAWMIAAAMMGMACLGPTGAAAQDEARIAEITLQERLQGHLGEEWTISSQFREASGGSYLFSDVVLQTEDIVIRITALAASRVGDRIVAEQVSVHQGAAEGHPLVELETLRLSGEGLAQSSFNALDCGSLSIGSSRPMVSVDAEVLVAQPNPALRIPGATSLGQSQARRLQGQAALARQSGGCVLELSAELAGLQVLSGLDEFSTARIHLDATLPAGTNGDRGTVALGIADLQMSGNVQGYSMETLALEASLPRAVIAAYLPFAYDDPEREARLREILFEDGADFSFDLGGLDFDFGTFLPGALATSHLLGSAEFRARVRDTGLDGTLSLDFPGAIELAGDAKMTFSENVMQVSSLQAPFMTNLEGLGLRIQSEMVLQDVTRLTGFRLSEYVPQVMTARMKDVPLIGGSYDSEIAAIGDWLALIEQGEEGYAELRPGQPVNLGMIAGLFVVNMDRALSTLGFAASPDVP
ncbi:hypothetical protein HUK65_17455 [Rhodobacteraceae bacterium 2376]|uniref:Uncharacterized protein n=1 Tax=Rhabdonatronobacter sediminivivens TaxID=2743469 RepID=A0A7Z0I2K3_9RHOB|nr:hypothetical protein [Rhabdonatronobacter sediminivivens]NYS26763.1 hypothetical protein [Rhabdonatronobacter sediminivivens]